MSNLNAVVNAEIDRNSELMRKRGAILEVGRIVQNKGGYNAAKRTIQGLVAKLKSKHSRNLNDVLAEAKLAAKLTRGGTRKHKRGQTRKTRKTIRN